MDILAIDIETSAALLNLSTKERKEHALDWLQGKIIGLGYYNKERKGFITDIKDIRCFLNDEGNKGTKFILQNGKFDQKWLYHNTGYYISMFFDTYLAAGILRNRPKRLGLESLVGHYLGLPPYKEDDMYEDMSAADPTAVANLCITDCEYTFRIAEKQTQLLREENLYDFYHEFIMPMGNLLGKMEYNGILVNKGLLMQQWETVNVRRLAQIKKMLSEHATLIQTYNQEQWNKYEKDKKDSRPKKIREAEEKYQNDSKKLESAIKRINKEIPDKKKEEKLTKEFNFASPKQVMWVLDHIGIMALYKGDPSSREEALLPHKDKHPFIKDLLELRGLEKLNGYYSSWNESIRVDGRIHANFNSNQVSVRTGRLSCSSPNLQQVPKGEPRQLFTAKTGHSLVVIDYAQIEPRVVAQLSQDRSLMNAFISGDDFYSVVIKGILSLKESPAEIKENHKELRNLGKTVALSILYGTGDTKLASLITGATGKEISYHKAKEIKENYFKAFPNLVSFREAVGKFITARGYITNIFGRHILVEEDEIYHKGVNSLVQGSASDLCIAAQICLQRALTNKGLSANLLLLVHDEVIYEVKEEDVKEFVQIAEKAMTEDVVEMIKIKNKWEVPLEVETAVGDVWAVKK